MGWFLPFFCDHLTGWVQTPCSSPAWGPTPSAPNHRPLAPPFSGKPRTDPGNPRTEPRKVMRSTLLCRCQEGPVVPNLRFGEGSYWIPRERQTHPELCPICDFADSTVRADSPPYCVRARCLTMFDIRGAYEHSRSSRIKADKDTTIQI